jgi:hypothetical protein
MRARVVGRGIHRARRGGVLLDAVLVVGVILIAAFLLNEVGLTFHEILHGAARFFGA